MKRYIEIKESNNHCNLCGAGSNEEMPSNDIIFDIGFVQELSTGNRMTQSYRLCEKCINILEEEIKKAKEVAKSNRREV